MGVYEQIKGMSNIDMQNSKETWPQIGKIFNLGKRKTHGAEAVSTELKVL